MCQCIHFFILSALLYCKTKLYPYLCDAVRGAKPYDLAEMIPYEPDMYNNSAGKRYAIHCFVGLWSKPFPWLYNPYNNEKEV